MITITQVITPSDCHRCMFGKMNQDRKRHPIHFLCKLSATSFNTVKNRLSIFISNEAIAMLNKDSDRCTDWIWESIQYWAWGWIGMLFFVLLSKWTDYWIGFWGLTRWTLLKAFGYWMFCLLWLVGFFFHLVLDFFFGFNISQKISISRNNFQ